jgi:Amt family ammonium transporter
MWEREQPIYAETVAELESGLAVLTQTTAGLWALFGIAGLLLTELGMSHARHSKYVLFKTMLQISAGFTIWWLFGYAFAFGDNDTTQFLNTSNFAGDEYEESEHYAKSLGYGAFGLLVVLLVNCGALERLTFYGSMFVAIVVTGWVYPVAVAWTWGGGWLIDGFDESYIDDDGAGPVHVLAGTLCLILTLFLGPRTGRFLNFRNDKYEII